MSNKIGQLVLIAGMCILAVSMVVIMILLTYGGESIDADGTTDLIATGTGDAISSILTSAVTSDGISDESEPMTNAPNDTESAATETETDTDEVTTAEVTTAENTTAPAESSEPETTESSPKVTETEAPRETSAPSEVELTNPEDIDPTLPMIALTFDDGPGAYTDRLLDILEQYGVRATFYVVGTQARKYESIIVREANEGHEIGIHTENHTKLTTVSYDEIINEIVPLRNWIYSVTGKLPMTLRPPYGKYDDNVLAASNNENFIIVRWSVDSLDWETKNADMIYDEIMNDVFDGCIILCHDIHETTVDAMETVIPALLEKGYQFVTVSELLSYKDGGVTTGVVYKKK